jgi:hypothetical protein
MNGLNRVWHLTDRGSGAAFVAETSSRVSELGLRSGAAYAEFAPEWCFFLLNGLLRKVEF